MGFTAQYGSGTEVSEYRGFLYVTTGSGYSGRVEISDTDRIPEQAARIAHNPHDESDPGDFNDKGEWVASQ